MKKIAITGNIGCGKSFISNYFETTLNIPVFNSDYEAKELYKQCAIQKQLIDHFGTEIYHEGNINKQLLADLIFKHSEHLTYIEQVLYPALNLRFEAWAEQYINKPYVLYESAIIYEKGLQNHFEAVILITASEETRIRRVMFRDQCSRQAVLERMKKQWAEDQKKSLADFIIDHDIDEMPINDILRVDKEIRQL